MTTVEPTAGLPAPTHKVSIGEFRVAGGSEKLVIHGLGSCVALLLHDPKAGVSALGHILLPEPPARNAPDTPGRFASTAVPAMLQALKARGARPERIIAKVAGAAQMFRYEHKTDEETVGARNLKATLQALERLGLTVAASDTGGSHGRTLVVEAGTGRILIRAVRVEEKYL